MATRKPKSLHEQTRAEASKSLASQVVDVNNPETRAQLQRDWQLISASPQEREIIEWLDDVRYWPPDEPGMPNYGDERPAEKK